LDSHSQCVFLLTLLGIEYFNSILNVSGLPDNIDATSQIL